MKNFFKNPGKKTALMIIASLFVFGAITTYFSTTYAQNSTQPKLQVITPSEGQTIYGNKVPVLFSVENINIVDYQTNKLPTKEQGHIHLWLDDTNPTPVSAVKLIEDSFTFSDVPYGNHTLKAELVNNDHTSFKPPIDTTVEFISEAVASPPPTAASGFDKNTALVILVVVALVIVAAWWYTKEEDEEEMESQSEKSKSKVSKKKTAKGIKKLPAKKRK
ncbi:hypothetical protein A3A48_00400 [Candidatus Curtissbacteria bacterium RIFCSPLOWO2_01_FULL_37_9]|uniref:DUF4399 domain-containing protein n=1 Tax=Candidatus Curtissbacteria bacterium RIFCSPLOWO2_01_FULL_37_9 TaxID=1797724 RepID=A0A1F5GRL3_9BACT|nr:MAG: hypothetical protein A3A48_00400 [Candidatus Curtissbacteria bacterium RIFCSPLOWO2_01_FULL_37_9]